MIIKIGLAQTANTLDIDKNFKSIMLLLNRFEKCEAHLILFPECSLSGFSAKMRECTLDKLQPFLDEIHNWTKRTGIEVILPTAVVKNSLVYNSGWWFSMNEARQFYKLGLTDSEKKFFSIPKIPGPKVFEIKGFRFSVLICYEVENAPWTYFQPYEVDAILWPGYWGWDLESKWEPEHSTGKPNPIFSNVANWKSPLLQSNFAFNDLEGHTSAGPEGLSYIIDASNKLIWRGPHKKVGGTLVTLEKTDGSVSVINCETVYE